MIKAEALCYRVGNASLLKETTQEFQPGRFHVIMGANGAGKSTLLKLLSGELKPSGGKVMFNGADLATYSKHALARQRAVLSQHYHLAFPVTAEEVVLMGRYPYFTSKASVADLEICKAAVAVMNAENLMKRDYTTLSGGEAQKVQMSRVLAQIWSHEKGKEKLLFLDEPVSHLDVKYQYLLMKAAKDLCQKGTTVIAVLHDLNLTLQFADSILLMKEGRLCYKINKPEELTTDMIEDIFGLRPRILQTAAGEQAFVLF